MSLIGVLLFVCFVAFAARRTLTYLHVFQQDEYDSARFLSWMGREFAVDRRVTFGVFLCALLRMTGVVSKPVTAILLTLIFLAACLFEANPLRSAKKALVMTSRAKRTYGIALSCSVALGLCVAITRFPPALWVLPVQAIPLTLVVATWLLIPVEKRIQLGFWKEAHEKLLVLKPKIIGITGSYGKTSVKHILGHILDTQGPTLITPGSINTPMGISRIVREKLTNQHKFFVCEMGAYGPGSIARLCDLAPPDLGVIVSIGFAHHERFGSLDAVARTKFELAEKTVTRRGQVVASEAFLPYEAASAFLKEHDKNCTIVGFGPEADMKIVSTSMNSDGVRAEIVWSGRTYALQAPLFGNHHAFNIALAFAAACELGVSPEDARDAITSTPQIKHRLEVRRDPSGTVVIDDAYNSNPTGFANALEMLDVFRKTNGRRILLTPGMVELGSAHDEQHEIVGRVAAQYCDIVLAVKPERIPSMLAAYRKRNAEGEVLPFSSFAEAQAWVKDNIRPEDVVLIENDLPDLYERKLKL